MYYIFNLELDRLPSLVEMNEWIQSMSWTEQQTIYCQSFYNFPAVVERDGNLCTVAGVDAPVDGIVCVGVGTIVGNDDFLFHFDPPNKFSAGAPVRRFFYPFNADQGTMGYFLCHHLGEQPHCHIQRCDPETDARSPNVKCTVRSNPDHDYDTKRDYLIIFIATTVISAGDRLVAPIGPDKIVYPHIGNTSDASDA